MCLLPPRCAPSKMISLRVLPYGTWETTTYAVSAARFLAREARCSSSPRRQPRSRHRSHSRRDRSFAAALARCGHVLRRRAPQAWHDWQWTAKRNGKPRVWSEENVPALNGRATRPSTLWVCGMAGPRPAIHQLRPSAVPHPSSIPSSSLSCVRHPAPLRPRPHWAPSCLRA